MRIRITGTREECDAAVRALRLAVNVLSAGEWRRWTRHDPTSQIGALYLDAELTEGQVDEVADPAPR